jgi:hypothetical protein
LPYAGIRGAGGRRSAQGEKLQEGFEAAQCFEMSVALGQGEPGEDNCVAALMQHVSVLANPFSVKHGSLTVTCYSSCSRSLLCALSCGCSPRLSPGPTVELIGPNKGRAADGDQRPFGQKCAVPGTSSAVRQRTHGGLVTCLAPLLPVWQPRPPVCRTVSLGANRSALPPTAGMSPAIVVPLARSGLQRKLGSPWSVDPGELAAAILANALQRIAERSHTATS